mgnify:CR=1 FL=1|jgi:hypothetical protein
MSAMQGPTLIAPTLQDRLCPPLSSTEIWKANLLAIYTKQYYAGHQETSSWQMLADELRASIKGNDWFREEPWVRTLEHTLPQLDPSLNKVCENTGAAQVLGYLKEFSAVAATKAAHRAAPDGTAPDEFKREMERKMLITTTVCPQQPLKRDLPEY